MTVLNVNAGASNFALKLRGEWERWNDRRGIHGMRCIDGSN